MSPFARLTSRSLLLPLTLVAGLVACSSEVNGNAENGAAAVTDCAQVRSTPTQTKQTDDSGNVLSTTMTVDANGCIAADTPPAKLVDALVALVEDDAKLARVSNASGKIFSKYNAHAPTGHIDDAAGISRTIDVTFNASKSPSTTIQVTLKKSSTGELSFRLVNTKGIGVFLFTAVATGGLDVRLTAKPTASGVTIGGRTTVVVQPGYEDNVTGMDELPSLVIHWLQDQIANPS